MRFLRLAQAASVVETVAVVHTSRYTKSLPELPSMCWCARHGQAFEEDVVVRKRKNSDLVECSEASVSMSGQLEEAGVHTRLCNDLFNAVLGQTER